MKFLYLCVHLMVFTLNSTIIEIEKKHLSRWMSGTSKEYRFLFIKSLILDNYGFSISIELKFKFNLFILIIIIIRRTRKIT